MVIQENKSDDFSQFFLVVIAAKMTEWAKVATGVSITISASMVVVATIFALSIYQDVNIMYEEAMAEMDEFNVN